MRIFFFLGVAFLVIAFASASAEPFLVMIGRGGLMTSTYDLWYALAPRSLVLSQIRIERAFPILWDPVLRTLLMVPAWLLFGVPGGALAWLCRPHKETPAAILEEYHRQRESLFVIDELSREARKDPDFDPAEDDRAPVHLLFDLEQSEDEEIRASVLRGDTPHGYPSMEELERAHEHIEHDMSAERISAADIDDEPDETSGRG